MFKKLANDYREEFRSKCRDSFLQWYDSKDIITVEQYQQWFDETGMNSYERNMLYEKMDLSLVLFLLKHHVGQQRSLSLYELPRHYGEAIQFKLVPRLLQLIEKAGGE